MALAVVSRGEISGEHQDKEENMRTRKRTSGQGRGYIKAIKGTSGKGRHHQKKY